MSEHLNLSLHLKLKIQTTRAVNTAAWQQLQSVFMWKWKQTMIFPEAWRVMPSSPVESGLKKEKIMFGFLIRPSIVSEGTTSAHRCFSSDQLYEEVFKSPWYLPWALCYKTPIFGIWLQILIPAWTPKSNRKGIQNFPRYNFTCNVPVNLGLRMCTCDSKLFVKFSWQVL